MPKLKTHKATKKRFQFTGSQSKRKVLRRQSGQDHFNARESGVISMRKRRDIPAHETQIKTIKKLTPYG
ncbi:MAG: bL35 family ribosomal protein [Patescibacteria group bacterium]